MKRTQHFFAAAVIGLSISAQADDSVLRLAIGSFPPQQAQPFATSMPPAITVNGILYDGLTRYTRDGHVIPWLAVAWEHTDDRTWRFTLRDGVTFSNGVPFTANSVVGVVNYLINDARPIDSVVNELPKMSAARAIDARTVEIVTAEPMPLFARYAMLLLIPEIGEIESLGIDGFTRAPVGTGPYTLENWGAARVKFKAFDTSWRKPIIPNLEIIAVPDVANRTQALIAGQADIAVSLGLEQANAVKQEGGNIQAWPNDTVGSITMVSTRGGPFADKRVRQALNMAFDRATIAAVLYDGTVVPATQPAARGMFGYDPGLPPIPYDPARAKELLAEAGYPDGFKFVMETTSAVGVADGLYQQIAADFARIGVDMEIRVLPSAQFLKNAFQTGEYADAITVPWNGLPVGDIMRGVEMFSCAHAVPWTCDPAIMPTIDAIRQEWDEDKALKMRRELMSYYRDQSPAILLFETVLYTATTARVKGFEDIFGFVLYEKISFAGE